MVLKKSLLAGVAALLLLAGCGSDDEVTEFNKPALYWYQQIAGSISTHNMDKA